MIVQIVNIKLNIVNFVVFEYLFKLRTARKSRIQNFEMAGEKEDKGNIRKYLKTPFVTRGLSREVEAA